MNSRKHRLERGIVTLFKQACHEGHTEAAEHLLRALEAIDGTHTGCGRVGNRSALAEAYLVIAICS